MNDEAASQLEALLTSLSGNSNTLSLKHANTRTFSNAHQMLQTLRLCRVLRGDSRRDAAKRNTDESLKVKSLSPFQD